MLSLGNHDHHELHTLFLIRCPTVVLYSWEAMDNQINSNVRILLPSAVARQLWSQSNNQSTNA